MRLYLPGDLVAEIIVVENSTSPTLVEFRQVLWGEYGNLAGKVRFRSAVKSPQFLIIPRDGFPSRS